MANPQLTTSPDLTGKTKSDAVNILTNGGLTVGAVTEAASDKVPVGNVISSSPAASANVAPGASVDIVVSTGPAAVTVPEVTGSAQSAAESALQKAGLAVKVTPVSHTTVGQGLVVATRPPAGARLPSGFTVQMDVSTGHSQVKTPDVTGLTRFAADGTLRSAGLVVGTVSTGRSSAIPAGGVIEQSPAPGTPLPAGSRVDVQISSGVQKGWGDWIRTGAFSLLTVILLVGIIWGITETDGGFLAGLADEKTARGLITFLIAVTTVGIALILALSTVVLEDSPENDKRFDRGKQVLTILIGVLGTIVGFYFGAASNPQTAQAPPTAPAALTITTQTLPPGAAKQTYPSVSLAATGGTAPLTWSATGLPAGLTLEPKTGALTGTPLAAGTSQVAVSVTDSSVPPRKADKQLQLEVK